MIKLVLLRHGQSTWNRESRFTGWTDVPLTERGAEEAKRAGKILKENGFEFDIAFTSVLQRTIDTANIVLTEMGIKKTELIQSWRLNERHYGALQGLNKAEMAAKYGEEQVHKWRRSYDIKPPELTKNDSRWPGNDAKYNNVDKKDIPLSESLKDTVERVLPYWKMEIAPSLKKGKKVLISASHNSLRALVKYLDSISDDKIISFTIPYGYPLVYELDDNLLPIKHYFLGNPAEIKKAIEEIENQGKAKK